MRGLEDGDEDQAVDAVVGAQDVEAFGTVPRKALRAWKARFVGVGVGEGDVAAS